MKILFNIKNFFIFFLLLIVSCSDTSWVKDKQLTFEDSENDFDTRGELVWNKFVAAPDEIRFEDDDSGYLYYAGRNGRGTKFFFECPRKKLCIVRTEGRQGDILESNHIEISVVRGNYRARAHGSDIWITYVNRN